jgi:hypothetical protein
MVNQAAAVRQTHKLIALEVMLVQIQVAVVAVDHITILLTKAVMVDPVLL